MLCKPADNPRPDLGAELGGGGEEEDGVDHELAVEEEDEEGAEEEKREDEVDGVDHELAAWKYFHEEQRSFLTTRREIFVQGGKYSIS